MRKRNKIISFAAGAAAIVGIAAIPANADAPKAGGGYQCRAWASESGAGFRPCVFASGSANPTIQGSLETLSPNRDMDWWGSLWRVNGNDSVTLVSSQELGDESTPPPAFGGHPVPPADESTRLPAFGGHPVPPADASTPPPAFGRHLVLPVDG